MFGIEEKVARVREALIKALRAKSVAIMATHASKAPEQIPKHDLARSLVLSDIAEILVHLKIEEDPKPSGHRR